MDFSRIESLQDIESYIRDLHYALNHNASIRIQMDRLVDEHREEKFTNKYTITYLFPNEDPREAVARELKTLTSENYIETLRDIRCPHRNELRVFVKEYGSENVYIKIRVELINKIGVPATFILSFHFAERKIDEAEFPYKEKTIRYENNQK